jgi:putative oxidoreductase
MSNKFFSADAVWQGNILALVRMTIGLFLIYHGAEIFDKTKMDDYAKWVPDMKLGSPLFASYLGKTLELISGVLLLMGFLTRLACVFILLTFLMITFYIGEGRVLMEEQHPFMFCIFAFLFLFLGAGKWSVDRRVFKR